MSCSKCRNHDLNAHVPTSCRNQGVGGLRYLPFLSYPVQWEFLGEKCARQPKRIENQSVFQSFSSLISFPLTLSLTACFCLSLYAKSFRSRVFYGKWRIFSSINPAQHLPVLEKVSSIILFHRSYPPLNFISSTYEPTDIESVIGRLLSNLKPFASRNNMAVGVKLTFRTWEDFIHKFVGCERNDYYQSFGQPKGCQTFMWVVPEASICSMYGLPSNLLLVSSCLVRWILNVYSV